MVIKYAKISLYDDDCDRLLQNYEFQQTFEGDIKPNKKGKCYKRNKKCREEYQNLCKNARSDKEGVFL